MKRYARAPLPFVGQKRQMLSLLVPLLYECSNEGILAPDMPFVDVFGGSGLLAHNIKRAFPNRRVIWNDFDDYQSRLDNVAITNEILSRLGFVSCKGKAIPNNDVVRILEILQEYEQNGKFVDYITIGAWLLFSGNSAKDFETLKKQKFYNCLPCSPYCINGYLEGVERVRGDFVQLMQEFENAFFILDPPYFRCDSAHYESFGIKDFMRLLTLLRPPFMLFSSNKSGILEFLEVLQGFENIDVRGKIMRINKSSIYEDYCILQKSPPPRTMQGACIATLALNF